MLRCIITCSVSSILIIISSRWSLLEPVLDLAQFPRTTEISWKVVNNKHQHCQCKPGNPMPWPRLPWTCSAGSARFSRATLHSLLRTALRPLRYYTCSLFTASPQPEPDGRRWAISSGWTSLLTHPHVEKKGWANCSPTAAPETALLLWYVHSHWVLIFSLVGLVYEMPVASRAPQQ